MDKDGTEAERDDAQQLSLLAEPSSVRRRVPATSAHQTALRKPVETILLHPRDKKVTLQMRRFFNALLRHAQLHPPGKSGYHEIALAQLTADTQYESGNMEYLADVLNRMMATVVNWGDSAKNLKGPKYRWDGAPLLGYASLRKSERQPTTLVFDFHPELRAQLLDPDVYAHVSLEMNARMSTHASLALYELGSRYLTNKNGLTAKRPWREWLVPLTGNPDIDPDTEYKYFARDVLKPALAEVNEAQEQFEMSASATKVGRRVEFLQFIVKRKPSLGQQLGRVNGVEVDVADLVLIGRLLNLGVPQASAEQFYSRYGAERLKKALAAMEARSLATHLEPIKDPARYAKKVLEEGDLETAKPIEATPFVERPAEISGSAVTFALTRKYMAYQVDALRRVFAEAPPDHREGEYDRFEHEKLSSLGEPVRRVWNQFRVSHRPPELKMPPPLVAVPFFEWLAFPKGKPPADDVLAWAHSQGHIVL